MTTAPAPGGLIDKGTEGKTAGRVPLIEEVCPMVAQRLLTAGSDPDTGCSPGPTAAGSLTTAVLT